MEKIFFTSAFAKSSKFKWDFLSKIKSQKEWNRLADSFDEFLIFKESKKYKSFSNKIPKKIHQIWIGPKKMPNNYKIWTETWKKYNPEWEYKLWNEEMINDLCLKNKEAYDSTNNPGFKSDLARYEILNRFGGLYVDTDFQCLNKIPDCFLKYEFVSSIAFDYSPHINNAIFLSISDSVILKKLINSIKTIPNINDPYAIMNSSGPFALTRTYMSMDIKEKKKYLILPSDIFYPYPNFMLSSKIKREDFITKESIAMHHWGMSWIKKNNLLQLIQKIINKLKIIYKKF